MLAALSADLIRQTSSRRDRCALTELIRLTQYKLSSVRLAERARIVLLAAQGLHDHRMDRCWLQGALSDALHALSCAAGYNIRWLLRAIARLGPKLVLLRLLRAAVQATSSVKSSYWS